jgi:hypothetical protein
VRLEIRIDDPNDVGIFLSELSDAAALRRDQVGQLSAAGQRDGAKAVVESVRVLVGVAAQIGAQVLIEPRSVLTR